MASASSSANFAGAAASHPVVGGKQPRAYTPSTSAATPLVGTESLSSASSDEDAEGEDDDGDFQAGNDQAEGSGTSASDDDDSRQQQQHYAPPAQQPQVDSDEEDEAPVQPRVRKLKLVSKGKQRQQQPVLDDPEADPELYGLRRSVCPPGRPCLLQHWLACPPCMI